MIGTNGCRAWRLPRRRRTLWWWSRVRRETSFCPAHKSRSFTPPSFHGGRSFRQRSFALHNTPRFNAVRNARAAMGTTAAVGASALVARHVNVTRNANAVQRSRLSQPDIERPVQVAFSFHLWLCAYEAAGPVRNPEQPEFSPPRYGQSGVGRPTAVSDASNDAEIPRANVPTGLETGGAK